MAFFDKLSETITTRGKDVANKAKEIAEVTSLNSKISAQEDLISKYFKEIGRFMYEHREKQCDNGLEERFHLVDAAYEEIDRLKKEIRRIKGIKECESCGAEVPADAAFCPKCGNAVPEDVPDEVEAEEVREVAPEEGAQEAAPEAESTEEASAEAEETAAEEEKAE